MHRMLQILEVLLNIFCRCVPYGFSVEDCKTMIWPLWLDRAFTEPALYIL